MNIDDLYRFWWLHDARWYQEVAQEVGYDVANRINKKVLNDIAKRIAKKTLASANIDIDDLSFEKKVEMFSNSAKKMWPDAMLEFDYEISGDNTFEVNVRNNFALVMLDRAGSLDKYNCPCLELRNGWFEGLGIKVKENTIRQCLRDGAPCCTFHAEIEQEL